MKIVAVKIGATPQKVLVDVIQGADTVLALAEGNIRTREGAHIHVKGGVPEALQGQDAAGQALLQNQTPVLALVANPLHPAT